jgi:hypothetical protein
MAAEAPINPVPEPEVTDLDLKKLGCPYRIPQYELINAWLIGYRAGLDRGERIATETADEVFGQMRDGLGGK